MARCASLALLIVICASAARGDESLVVRGPGRASAPALSVPQVPRSAAEALATVSQAPAVTRLQSPEPNVNAEPKSLGNRLAPRSTTRAAEPSSSREGKSLLDEINLQSDHVVTVVGALAIVLALMLASLYAVKKASGKTNRLAPQDVAQVVGRVALGGKQQAQLLHLGNKILLVSATAAGVETLGEIDDPHEVARILAACSREDGRGTQATFEDVFRGFDRDGARGFLGDEGRR